MEVTKMLQLTDQTNPKPLVRRQGQILSQTNPVYTFKPQFFGQAAFLMNRCEEEGIKTHYQSGGVHIYAKKKREKFEELIRESFTLHKERVGLTAKMHKFSNNKKTFAVGVKDEDCIYTYETAFTRLIIGQYLGYIPQTKYLKVLPTQVEWQIKMIEKGVMV
jgi:hypothetical protein